MKRIQRPFFPNGPWLSQAAEDRLALGGAAPVPMLRVPLRPMSLRGGCMPFRKYTSQEREERAREDYHDPTAGIGGAPPARSALTLRLILAIFGLLGCTAGAVVFLVVVSQPVISALWAFFAAVALADIAVVTRRKLRGEPG
jgi:hypothetical protein